jgi:methanogenic corrinoid protein MtbC1
VFATLPGEAHALGLQMAALVVAERRCRVLYLGTDTPVADIAGVARDISARAVAVSVSAAGDPATVRHHLDQLRASLPRRVTLVVGGAGAADVTGGIAVTQFVGFAALSQWASGVAT